MKNYCGFLSVIVVLCFMLMLREATAGAPEGLVASVDYQTKRDLAETFRGAQYYCQESTDQCLAENVAHYYSDNRALIISNVPEHRMVDAVICIMMQKGNPRFARFEQNASFVNWCRSISKTKP